MNQFFKSKKGKILIAVLVVLVGFMLQSASSGNLNTVSSKIIGTVTAPFSKVTTGFGNQIKSVLDKFQKAEYLRQENDELKAENAQLTGQLVELDNLKNENQNLKESVGIKQQNPTFEMVPATVTSRDPAEQFYSFIIDQGSNSGIQRKNAVITKDGLVGIISEVQDSYSVVTTILDPKINVGSFASASGDSGVVTGSIEFMKDKKTKMIYISRNHQIQAGALIATSGSSDIFPKNIVVGTVDEVNLEQDGLSMTARITPVVDVETVRQVQVVKSFQ